MAQLKITGLHKRFGGVHAVRGVDLEIPDGEFTVLVGPSGCGKSTLLRTIAGLEMVDDGTIEIDGEVMNDVRPSDRDVAMVFQNYALYPHMNVYKNIAFGLMARKIAKAEIDARVKRAAAMLDISDLLARLPRQLSGGQRQRVAIGRAIVRNPRLFLFDEPLSNLDAQLRDGMRGEIKRLHQELRATMIYVTHDQIEAMTLADRIVLLKDGQVEQQGAPLDLYERPATRFVAGFLGSPQMNFVPAKLTESEGGIAAQTKDGVVLPLPPDRVAALKAAAGRDVVLGIRPEHIAHAGRGRRGNSQAAITANVELIQPTGSRAYVTFRLADVGVVAEVDSHDARRPGESIALELDMTRAVLFDPRTNRVV